MLTTEHRVYVGNKTLAGRTATIIGTDLGLEDDLRFFWASVRLDWDGLQQSFCPMLATPDERTALVHSQIMGILGAAHCRRWEDLIGKQVIALYEDPLQNNDPIIGLCDLEGENVYLTLDAVVD